MSNEPRRYSFTLTPNGHPVLVEGVLFKIEALAKGIPVAYFSPGQPHNVQVTMITLESGVVHTRMEWQADSISSNERTAMINPRATGIAYSVQRHVATGTWSRRCRAHKGPVREGFDFRLTAIRPVAYGPEYEEPCTDTRHRREILNRLRQLLKDYGE